MEENTLIEQLIPAVEQQMHSPQTPFVKKHYNRLISLGESAYEAKKLIALCLTDETNRMYTDQRNFDLKRYESLLTDLPEVPI